MAGRLIFHIDGDAFFASVEQSFNPSLQGKPVIVGGLPTQRGVVHTASYEARRYGVRTGMPLAEAKELCSPCIFIKGNFQHYQAVSRQLQEIYLRFTPQVEFTSLDDAYLDMTGTERIHPSPLKTAAAIWNAVWEEVGISVSIGIASGKALANIASGVLKPAGIFDVPPEAETAFLSPLPVDILPGIGRKTATQFHDLGIFTIKQLRELPRVILEDYFGVNGATFYKLARGIDRRPVKKRILPRSVSRETTFEEDTIDMQIVRATLRYLTERVAAKLRDNGQTARRISLKVRYSDFRQEQAHSTRPEATDSGSILFREALELLRRVAVKRTRIRLVGVRVSEIEWKNTQEMLDFGFEEKINIDEAVDKIREKYGFTAIMPAEILRLRKKYRMERSGFVLHSPALTE